MQHNIIMGQCVVSLFFLTKKFTRYFRFSKKIKKFRLKVNQLACNSTTYWNNLTSSCCKIIRVLKNSSFVLRYCFPVQRYTELDFNFTHR